MNLQKHIAEFVNVHNYPDVLLKFDSFRTF